MNAESTLYRGSYVSILLLHSKQSNNSKQNTTHKTVTVFCPLYKTHFYKNTCFIVYRSKPCKQSMQSMQSNNSKKYPVTHSNKFVTAPCKMLLCAPCIGYIAHMDTKRGKQNNSAHNADNGVSNAQETVQKQRSIGGLSPDPEQAQKQLAAITPHQFKPGQSGNPNGRPKDIVKEVGKRIASARASKALKPKERKLATDLGINPDDITLLEHIMLSLATSKHPLKIALFLERTYGKVPNININAEVNAQLVTKFRSKFTDAELEDIANGANPMDMLFDKLPDVDDAPRLDDEDYIDADVE